MTGAALVACAAAAIAAGVGCGLDNPTRPAETADASPDAPIDASFDAPIDAPGPDATVDAMPDAMVDARPCVGELAGGTVDAGALYDDVSNRVGLVTTEYDGWWFSQIFDAGVSRDWSTMSWLPLRPSGKPLPDGRAEEAGYPAGNVSMLDNVFLAHLDETMGVDFTDSSGLDHSGACSPPSYCPTLDEDGVYARAPFFSGTAMNNRIDVPNHTDLEPANYTLEAWARIGTLPAMFATGMVATKGYNGGGLYTGYSIEIDSTQVFKCYSAVTGPTVTEPDRTVMGTTTFNALSGFVHVACTFDGSTLRIYVNGDEENNGPLAGAVAYATEDPDFMMGAFGFNQWFNGWVDEVAVTTTALTSTEVKDRFLRGAMQLRLQVRSCDDPACAGEVFVGPDGTPGSYFTEGCRPPGLSPSTGPPEISLNHIDCDGDGVEDHPGVGDPIPANQYVQVLVHFNASTYANPIDTGLLQLLDLRVCE